MRPPILRRKPHQQHAQKQRHHLQRVEQQRKGLVCHPAYKHQQRDDKKRDLDAGANGDGEGEVDLVAVGDEDGGDVLGGVADDGEEDEAEPFGGDGAGLPDAFEGVGEGFGGDVWEVG